MANQIAIDIQEIGPSKFIFAVLHVLANKIQGVADRGPGEVSLKQWLLVIMILQFEEESPTLTQVSEALGSSRQNVKQLALKLADKGLIKMEKDSNDARILRLSVCTKFYEYFQEKLVYQEHFLELLYKDIPEEEVQVTARCLQKLLENIIKMEELVNGGHEI